MARTATLPILNGESGLSRYLAEIRKFPMLEPQQEYMFAKRWREHDDRDAAHHLVTSHLGPQSQEALTALGRQALHAYLLALEHPRNGTILEWISDLPDDLTLLRDCLRATQ